MFETLYFDCEHELLSDINRDWIEAICRQLGIGTRIRPSMDYHLTETDPSRRLLEICLQARANVYLSGPAARAYLDERCFCRQGSRCAYMDYSGYREYPQFHPPFEHAVTVLDLLFMTGQQAAEYLEREAHAA